MTIYGLPMDSWVRVSKHIYFVPLGYVQTVGLLVMSTG